MNRDSAERYSEKNNSDISIIISIHSTYNDEPHIIMNKHNKIKDIIFERFNDVDSESPKYTPITDEIANEIADFIFKYKDNSKVELCIVHCDAGQSRSAGVAAAILKFLYNDDTQIFSNKLYKPNMLVYRKVLNALYTKQEAQE